MIELCSEYLSIRSSIAKWLSVRLRTKWFWVRSSCSHLTFRFRDCFEQEGPWHLGNYRVWIHSETRKWHNRNIQKNIESLKSKRNKFEYFYNTLLRLPVNFSELLNVWNISEAISIFIVNFQHILHKKNYKKIKK